ncbi:hypothetical protein LP417_31390 [Polaromonas sp. P1-6]|nr:hypothetical protein LP417_31390 [Polaromonas sp. P1-6]
MWKTDRRIRKFSRQPDIFGTKTLPLFQRRRGMRKKLNNKTAIACLGLLKELESGASFLDLETCLPALRLQSSFIFRSIENPAASTKTSSLSFGNFVLL